ncbi:MAG: hypothetical protein AB7O65_11660 [Candidatus Korobacteraceae bacterium]
MGILENAKQVASAVQEINNLELYQRVLNLRTDILDLVEENKRLHDENDQLKRTLAVRAQMIFKEPFYYQDGDATPFCPACWEVQQTTVHVVMRYRNETETRWDCPGCKQMYLIKDPNARASNRPLLPRRAKNWALDY